MLVQDDAFEFNLDAICRNLMKVNSVRLVFMYLILPNPEACFQFQGGRLFEKLRLCAYSSKFYSY